MATKNSGNRDYIVEHINLDGHLVRWECEAKDAREAMVAFHVDNPNVFGRIMQVYIKGGS